MPILPLKGRIYEIQIDSQQQKEVMETYLVSNVRQGIEGIKVKIITKVKPEQYPHMVAPANLEDVYLYYFEHKTSNPTSTNV